MNFRIQHVLLQTNHIKCYSTNSGNDFSRSRHGFLYIYLPKFYHKYNLKKQIWQMSTMFVYIK